MSTSIETCIFQKPNEVTINKKPEMCHLIPTKPCQCTYYKDVQYCEMRWFEYRKRGLIKE